MANIPLIDAFGTLTKSILEKVKVQPETENFFRKMFTDVESEAYMCEFDVEVDVKKGFDDVGLEQEAKVISFDKNTTKQFVPANYKYVTPYSATDAFLVLARSGETVSQANYMAAVDKIAENVQKLYTGMDITEEILCSLAMQTGVVPFINQSEIDFKMKSDHLLAYDAGRDFAIDTVDPGPVFELMAKRLISNGRATGKKPFIVVLGDNVLNKFQNNPFVKERADIKNFDYSELTTGLMDGTGAVPQGMVSYGSFKFILMSYPATYTNSSGVETPYMDINGMLMKSQDMRATFWHGGIPQGKQYPGMANPIPVPVKGKRVPIEYYDKKSNQLYTGFWERPVPIIGEVNKVINATITNA